MIGTVIAGLGALAFMSNPPRRKRRRAKSRRRNPTAKDVRLLVLLQQELALAQNKYENRSHRDNARALRKSAVEARLRYRRFWRAATEADRQQAMRACRGIENGRRKLSNPMGAGRLDREISQWRANLKAALSYENRGEIREATAMLARLEKAQRMQRKRSNPSKVSRTSMTDAETAIGGKAMLSSKRQHAWVMDKKNAQTVARQLKNGFHRVESSVRGTLGQTLYLVTDGYWFVADTAPNAVFARPSSKARRMIRAARKAQGSNPKTRYMAGHGGRPIISRAKAKKIAAEYGVNLPRLGYEVLLFKHGPHALPVYLGNISGTFIISDLNAVRDPISSGVAEKLGIKTNPRRAKRRRK